MNRKKIAVIGGGAAGLMACCKAAELGASVTLFERNKLLGMKLGINPVLLGDIVPVDRIFRTQRQSADSFRSP